MKQFATDANTTKKVTRPGVHHLRKSEHVKHHPKLTRKQTAIKF
jgi:hypothetical protein